MLDNDYIYPTVQNKNFFSGKEAAELESIFDQYAERIAQDYWGSSRPISQLRLHSMFHHFDDEKETGIIMDFTIDKVISYSKLERLELIEDFKEYAAIELKDLNDKIFEYKEKILTRLNDSNIKIAWFEFMNMKSSFEIHTDRLAVKDKYMDRPDDWDSLSQEDYMQDEYINGMNIYQGLVNINAPTTHGTILFDQMFPFTTYLAFDKEYSGYKDTICGYPFITFYKDDSPTRFGHTIKNFTYKSFSDDDFNTITNNLVDNGKFNRDLGYGLSLENLFFFDKPGTTSLWDSRRYHCQLPYSFKDQTSRKVLQFVCRSKI